MSVVDERVEHLESLLGLVQNELDSFRRQTQPHKTALSQINERTNNTRIVENSQRELDNLSSSIATTLDSLRTVTTNSTMELHAGYITSRPEAVIESRRLASQLGDLLLARDRKNYQHETLVARLGPQPQADEPSSEAEEGMTE